MSDGKKKRLSMLDNLAAAGAPAPPAQAKPASMMTANRALRSARDAVDSHNVWELDPWTIDDTRITDRLDRDDVHDLRDAIEANGQTVPILVRRHPTDDARYLLVYGRRRLEAIRSSDKVRKIRALVATLDDDAATRAQISENMARRDLSFIERALFAHELVGSGFGSQNQVAEVLTVTKSSVSMALSIIDTITPDLAMAIGAAQGIGRPRWDALAKGMEANRFDPAALIELAEDARTKALTALFRGDAAPMDPSVAAFEAVMKQVESSNQPAKPLQKKEKIKMRSLHVDGLRLGTLRKSDTGLRLDITDDGFADWLETRAEQVLEELHTRWKSRAED